MASVEFSDLLVVVGCLAGLVVAADRFLIVGAANLALRLRMSTVLVGVLIVGRAHLAAAQQRLHELIGQVYRELPFPVVTVPALPPDERVQFILDRTR